MITPTIVTEVDDGIDADINAIQDWEGFETLVRFLRTYYNANVDDAFDGPDTRTAKLSIGSTQLSVHHGPYGNSICSSGKTGISLVRRICVDLDKRLEK